MEYDDLIRDINNGKIQKIVFAIDGYYHYRKCSIERVSNTLFNGNTIESISVNLTKDGTEKVSFYKEFKEGYKLFKISGKRYTLKQLWPKVIVLQVDT